jgi:hypothetical protein
MICVCWYAACVRSTDLALMFWPRCAVLMFLCYALCCLGFDLLIIDVPISCSEPVDAHTLTCSSLLLLALTYLPACLLGSPRC